MNTCWNSMPVAVGRARTMANLSWWETSAHASVGLDTVALPVSRLSTKVRSQCAPIEGTELSVHVVNQHRITEYPELGGISHKDH